MATFGIVGLLLMNEVVLYFSSTVESGIRIDHKKEENHVKGVPKIEIFRFSDFLFLGGSTLGYLVP